MARHTVCKRACAALGALTLVTATAVGAAPAADETCTGIPQVRDRCEAWVATYDNPNTFDGAGVDEPAAAVVAGDVVAVVGSSDDADGGVDLVVVAYGADDGALDWVARYNGPLNASDVPYAAAAAPDGSRVYVTGVVDRHSTATGDLLTVAFDTASGDQVWADRYDGPAGDQDAGLAVTVSPDGAEVTVTGIRDHTAQGQRLVTVAYEAASGARRWVAAHESAGSSRGVGLATSPDGDRLFVVGEHTKPGGTRDLITLAYAAGESPDAGALQWTASLDSGGADEAAGVAVSPNGRQVFVTGTSAAGAAPLFGGNTVWSTASYDTSTGDTRWVSTHGGQAGRDDRAVAVAVDPAGGRVYVTGRIASLESCSDYGLVAYDADVGDPEWERVHSAPEYACDTPVALAVAPDGGAVYVAGKLAHPTFVLGVSGSGVRPPVDPRSVGTVAYDRDGARLWAARYNSGAELAHDDARALVLAPDGERLFVTGATGYPYGAAPDIDMVTIGYELSGSAQSQQGVT